jgi:hypothetical protein
MATKPSKTEQVKPDNPVALAATAEWERLRVKIEKKISSRKGIPSKKGEVKAWVRQIATETIK